MPQKPQWITALLLYSDGFTDFATEKSKKSFNKLF
jgi:hypothetical protein